jgi:hypothetical protein
VKRARIFSEVTPHGERYWVYEIREDDKTYARASGIRFSWSTAMAAAEAWLAPWRWPKT